MNNKINQELEKHVSPNNLMTLMLKVLSSQYWNISILAINYGCKFPSIMVSNVTKFNNEQ